jgi:hypoxanthine phosphoribosyltransferase/class 3 adenylate cyclase
MILRRLEVSKHYSGLQDPSKPVTKKILTYEDVSQGIDILTYAAARFRPDHIYGINRGGAIVGGMIAKRLGIPIVFILQVFPGKTKEVVNCGLSLRQLTGKKVLLVDDALRRGKHMRPATNYLRQVLKQKEIMRMVLLKETIANPQRDSEKETSMSDIEKYVYFTDREVFLPWDKEGQKYLISPQQRALQIMERLSNIGIFAQTNLEPATSHKEVIACYSDIRGFTKYCDALQARRQDAKIHDFTSDFFPLFYHALALQHLGFKPTELSSRDAASHSEFSDDLQSPLSPSGWKTLGDGMLVVWELDALERESKESATEAVLEAIQNARALFHTNLVARGDLYDPEVGKLRMGFGISRGDALRLDFPGLSVPDYAGTVLNVGARLVNLARPEGIVAELEFNRALLDDLAKKNEGKTLSVTLPGIEGIREIWCSKGVDVDQIRRLSRRELRS